MAGQISEPSDTININQCTVLGGVGYPFLPGDTVDLRFGRDALVIETADSTSADIPYLEIVDIVINGPGSITTGGGFIGGGFGVEGALEGMAVGLILNRLTSRTKIHTFIALVTHLGELHLHYGNMEPSALRIALSEVFTALRRLDPTWLHTRLKRLEAHHIQKLLSDGDFERLKQRLLVPPKREDLAARIGRCPGCDATIPLLSEECPKCKAQFGTAAAWKVRPL